MQLLKPGFNFENFDSEALLHKIEEAGRVCYQSASGAGSTNTFISNIIKRGHESVLEHEKITAGVICDRGVTHEIVRHRLASYSQESTRYCNYSGGVAFIIPPWVAAQPGRYPIDWVGLHGDPRCCPDALLKPENSAAAVWFWNMAVAERDYLKLLKRGWSPQEARSVLPNSLKTEIVMTMNIREWRHFFKLRTAPAAHPQMREVACPMLTVLQKRLPVLFEDIKI